MIENRWVVELLPIPTAFDEIFELIKKDHPDMFEVWKPQINWQASLHEGYGETYPPCDLQSAIDRAIYAIRRYSVSQHVRVRNLDTGEIIPGEALGAW